MVKVKTKMMRGLGFILFLVGLVAILVIHISAIPITVPDTLIINDNSITITSAILMGIGRFLS